MITNKSCSAFQITVKVWSDLRREGLCMWEASTILQDRRPLPRRMFLSLLSWSQDEEFVPSQPFSLRLQCDGWRPSHSLRVRHPSQAGQGVRHHPP
mmetsp:Transcript_16641/g.16732  ORF Transcript_16641/g.16732 Transcript_16641/m.16732 type:complete len:96 (-) Transcript_16641:1883-2170(-)